MVGVLDVNKIVLRLNNIIVIVITLIIIIINEMSKWGIIDGVLMFD